MILSCRARLTWALYQHQETLATSTIFRELEPDQLAMKSLTLVLRQKLENVLDIRNSL